MEREKTSDANKVGEERDAWRSDPTTEPVTDVGTLFFPASFNLLIGGAGEGVTESRRGRRKLTFDSKRFSIFDPSFSLGTSSVVAFCLPLTPLAVIVAASSIVGGNCLVLPVAVRRLWPREERIR